MSEVFPYIEQQGWIVEFGLAVGEQFNNPDHFLKTHDYMQKVHRMDGRIGTPPSRQQAILHLLMKVRPDVVIPLGIGDLLPSLRSARLDGLQARSLLAIHSTHTGTLADIVENNDVIDMVGVVSGLLNKWAVANVNNDRVRLVRNGVPPPLAENAVKTRHVFSVGYVGRIENEIKRASDLPKIAAEVVRRGVNFKLEIVGDGPAFSSIESDLSAIADFDSYCLHGHRSRDFIYREILPSISCLLLTSVTEGSPLALIEAMQHGVVPVVSEFHGYAAEGLLCPEQNCLTFPVGDVCAAALQLERLAKDPVLLERLSLAAIDSAALLYTQDSMLKGWVNALEDVMRLDISSASKNVVEHSQNFGRLERWGVPAHTANRLRRYFGKRFLHQAGFNEWPGSISVDVDLHMQIKNELTSIEFESASKINGSGKSDVE